MSLKLLLVSPSGTLVKDGQLNHAHMMRLGQVIARLHQHGVQVAIWSNQRWTVGPNKVPLEQYLSEMAGCAVFAVGMATSGSPARQRSGSVQPILQQFNVELRETILVGAEDTDLKAGVNNSLLLLRPAWYGGNLQYGFELKSIAELERFCLVFGIRQHPFYWRVHDAANGVNAHAMGPFSTFLEQYAKFGDDAYKAAKFEAGTLNFWHQLIVSTLYFSGLIQQVELITVFPGHKAAQKEKAFYDVLSLLGKCFRKPFYSDLLVRHADAAKSSNIKAAQRQFCTQLNTLCLNRFPTKYQEQVMKSPVRLKGKTVLVVDDICTSGRSLDTARAFLEAAEARSIQFCWLKTINSDLVSMSPAPALTPYEVNEVMHEPTSKKFGYHAHVIDAAAADELTAVLKAYQQWPAT